MSSLRTDTSLTKEKKSTGSKIGKVGKGSDQITQIKNLLISYKGQMKEKKVVAPEPAPKPAPKQRLSNLSASNSVSKMNVSVEQARSSQRSQEPKNRLIKSIDKKDTSKAFKKKDSGSPVKEGARSSSNLKSSAKPSPSTAISPNIASISSMKVLKKTLKSSDNRSSTKMTSSSKDPRVGRSTDASEKKTLDDSRKDLSLIAPSDQTKDSAKRKPLGSAASIRTGTSKLSLKVGIGVSSKSKKNAVEKSKTEENCEHGEFQEGSYKPHTQEQHSAPGHGNAAASTDFKKKSPEKPQNKLSSVITQVRQGQMFPDTSIKKLDLDKEVDLISSSRSRRDNHQPHPQLKIVHEPDPTWNKYYMSSLVQALRSSDDADPEVKLFKEHFFQTVQSIIFLQNVEKIDDALLVEKKVYLPPNLLSSPDLPRAEDAHPGPRRDARALQRDRRRAARP